MSRPILLLLLPLLSSLPSAAPTMRLSRLLFCFWVALPVLVVFRYFFLHWLQEFKTNVLLCPPSEGLCLGYEQRHIPLSVFLSPIRDCHAFYCPHLFAIFVSYK